MEFTVFQTAQEEEKRRVAGTPGEKDQRNKNHYLFNSGDLLHSICRGRLTLTWDVLKLRINLRFYAFRLINFNMVCIETYGVMLFYDVVS